MSWAADLDKVVRGFYSHFLMRDLIYVAGGALVITATLYCLQRLDDLAGFPWWKIVGLIVGAYFIGFAALEASVTINLFLMYPRERPYVDQEVEYLLKARAISAKWGPDTLVPLERIIIIKHLAAVSGSCSLLALMIV